MPIETGLLLLKIVKLIQKTRRVYTASVNLGRIAVD